MFIYDKLKRLYIQLTEQQN